MNGERLFDVGTIARRFGVSGETVRNWIRRKKLRAEITLTGRYKIPASALIDFDPTKARNSQIAPE